MNIRNLAIISLFATVFLCSTAFGQSERRLGSDLRFCVFGPWIDAVAGMRPVEFGSPGVAHSFVRVFTYDSLNRIANAEETYNTSSL